MLFLPINSTEVTLEKKVNETKTQRGRNSDNFKKRNNKRKKGMTKP